MPKRLKPKPRRKRKTDPAALSTAQLTAHLNEEWKKEIVGRYLPQVCDSLELLSEEEIWWRPNDASNSAGNLVLHLIGSMRQWIGAVLGGTPYVRKRDLEFSEKGPVARAELIRSLRAAADESAGIVAKLTPADLMKRHVVMGFDASGYHATIRIAAHFGYHTGQITYLTKMKRAKDLGFTRLPPLASEKK